MKWFDIIRKEEEEEEEMTEESSSSPPEIPKAKDKEEQVVHFVDPDDEDEINEV